MSEETVQSTTSRSEKALLEELDRLLSEPTLWSRMISREAVRCRLKRARDVWGDARNRYRTLFAGLVLMAMVLLVVSGPFFGMWGAVGWMVVLLMVIAASPLISTMMRRREIRRRRALDSNLFLSRLQEAAPGVPNEFALAARKALAAAYGVPVELVDAADTRRQSQALSRLNSPLALEIIADVDRQLGLRFRSERLLSAANAFADNHPPDVAGLIRLLYESMGSPEQDNSPSSQQ